MIQPDGALAQLLQGHDAVVSMVGILHGSAKAFDLFVKTRWLFDTFARMIEGSGMPRRMDSISICESEFDQTKSRW